MNNGYYGSQLPQQGYTPDGSISTTPYQSQMNPKYADEIFTINRGKLVTVYFSYPDSLEWRDKVFKGRLKDAGKDYIIITDNNNKDILLWLIYVNYAIFDEQANIN